MASRVVSLLSREGLSDTDFQKIAAEMNLSETAFLHTDTDDFKHASRFNLRWFTPTTEVSLCGHATLASAAVLYFTIGNTSPLLEFDTKSGSLGTTREGEELILNFPVNQSTRQEKTNLGELIKKIVDYDKVVSVEYSSGTKKLLLRLEDTVSREWLESLQPDIAGMLDCPLKIDIRGVIVTVKAPPTSQHNYDFYSRYFAPWNGIPEDPVTGSAHTVLVDYWSKQLKKTHLKGRQCSPRGGDIRMRLCGERVELIGRAVVMFSGTLSF